MRDEERRREKGKKELHRRQSKQAKRIRDVRFTSTDFFQTTKSFFIDLISNDLFRINSYHYSVLLNFNIILGGYAF